MVSGEHFTMFNLSAQSSALALYNIWFPLNVKCALTRFSLNQAKSFMSRVGLGT